MVPKTSANFGFRLLVITCLVASTFTVSTKVEDSSEDFFDYTPFFKGDRNDDFDWKLFRSILNDRKDENVIVSTFSTKILLGILSEAADGNSKQQLLSTLAPNSTYKDLRDLLKNSLQSLGKTSEVYKLVSASRLFIDNKMCPLKSFVSRTRQNYQASIKRVNFFDEESAASQINQWASNITHGKIKELLSAEKVQNAVAILANALYFRGTWIKKFDELETVYENFNVNEKTFVKVSMMKKDDYLPYAHSKRLNAKIVFLPFKSLKYVMTIIVPDEADGIDEVIEKVNLTSLYEEEITPTNIYLALPKFKFDLSLDLKENLKNLGITEIFDDLTKDLPGLGSKALSVSDVVQKTGINVNEEGTEVYAVGSIKFDMKFGGDEPTYVIVDRPFLFFIEDVDTGTLLFIGKVADPSKN